MRSIKTEAERDIAGATAQCLDDDAYTLNWMLRSLRELEISKRLCRTDANAQAALAWWKDALAGRIVPKAVSFFAQIVERDGIPPVFCGLSLCIPGLAPSLRVLVPYEFARRGLDGFRDSVWLLAPDTQKCGQTRWEPLARELSHAIANIPYSVRLRDRPLRGLLAEAHKHCQPLYIPDVRCAPRYGSATTAAVEEEPFLGMASVLYLPIAGLDLPKLAKLGSQAVLMLWSPIPGHWDHLESRALRPGVCQVTLAGLLPESLAPYFPWLHLLLLKENEKYTELGTQLVGILGGLERVVAASLDSKLLSQFHEKIAHGASSLVTAYIRPARGPCPRLHSWLTEQLSSATGPVSIVRRAWGQSSRRSLRSLNEAALTLTWRGRKSNANRTHFVGHLHDPESVLCHIPERLALEVREDIASGALRDAAANLSDDARELYAVDLEISRRYCGISFRFEPTKLARQRLYGSRPGFERYFATRRGLVVPPAGPDSFGIGLALNTRLAAGLGLYRRLYVSPNGTVWRVDLAVPLREQATVPRLKGGSA